MTADRPHTNGQLTGAQAVIRGLEDLGVTEVFGIPGGAILPVYHAMTDDTAFRFTLTRHEQAAGHAAEGYAVVTGKPGVCIVTSGPGATNMVTAIADAHLDSVPLVIITGQVAADVLGTDAFQEADITGITYPIVKHSYLVTNAQDIPHVLAEAYAIAQEGRPGPVVVDITKTAQIGICHYDGVPMPERKNVDAGDSYANPNHADATRRSDCQHQLDQASAMLQHSARPVFYVGGGAVRSRAAQALREMVTLSDAPVVTTLPARGIIDDNDPHALGMIGMHGTIAAIGAVQHCDLLIVVGARFDDRVTGKLSAFAPHAAVIHIDIDAAEIHKNRKADLAMHGDAATVLNAWCAHLRDVLSREAAPDRDAWWRKLRTWQEQYPLDYRKPIDGTLAPQWVVQELARQTSPDTIWVSGVGQHQMWASQCIAFHQPNHWVSSCGLGTMGFGLPAAIGAALAANAGVREDEGHTAPVWLIDGDGSFQMTSEELATAVQARLSIRIMILNNSAYGMVQQWQRLFYERHYSHTDLYDGNGTDAHIAAPVPDFVRLAQAYGCVGLRAETPEEVRETIAHAKTVTDRPVLIDCRVSQTAEVWPMVAAGAANDDVTYLPGITPLSRQSDDATIAVNRATGVEADSSPQSATSVTAAELRSYRLTILAANQPGVLTRICGLFARRAVNIDYISSKQDHSGLACITVNAVMHERAWHHIIAQIRALRQIHNVYIDA